MSLFLRRRGVVAAAGFRPIAATGGDDVFDEEIANVLYRIHVFTTVGSSDAFEVLSVGNSDGLVEYLVIGGGGAGGALSTSSCWGQGGGGAGGYRCSVVGEQSGRNTSAEPRLQVVPQTYAVTVGAGGASAQTPGQNSSLGTIVSLGGGRGANRTGTPSSGGSGGGGTGCNASGRPGASGTAGQGFNGGTGSSGSFGGAGGGGAGGNGANGINSGSAPGGAGGVGITSNITGTPTGRAGGGGGSGYVSKSTATDGGGRGGHNIGINTARSGENGVANTGGGGGADLGFGGSGIVVVRYPLQPV